MNEIYYKQRNSDMLILEKVPAQLMLRLLYSKWFMKPLLKLLVANKPLSSLYGWLMKRKSSRRNIPKFVQEYDINMNESLKSIDEFTSFNDFFIRELKPDARQLISDSDTLLSPADGKILVYENCEQSQLFNIKGKNYNLSNLLQDKQLSIKYENCSVAIIRLAPTDYHRFHFPADGFVKETKLIRGVYFSVSPIALHFRPSVFYENKRTITEVENTSLGDYLYLEIGATMVGSIKQTYTPNSSVSKGDEKGYFEFGGSTVILLFRNSKVRFDEDLLKNSNNNIETKIKMGESIGKTI